MTSPKHRYRGLFYGVVITGYLDAILLISQEATPKIEAQSMQEEPVPKPEREDGGEVGVMTAPADGNERTLDP